MNNRCSISFLLSILIAGYSFGQPASKPSDGELIFQSGFESDSKVIRQREDSDLAGVDRSLLAHHDWVNDLDNHPNIGNFNIQYQGGDSTMRYARIIAEPRNPENHVLHFWLDQPNVDNKKGRIQGNLYGNNGLKEIFQSVRMFLPDDFYAVRTYPREIHWLTIAEFWNNITWSQAVPYGFRITLGIGKLTPQQSDLYFILDAQDCELFADGKQKYTTIWAETNKNVKVPIGKWFTMDYYYKEGNDQDGRFYLSITTEGEKKQVVFDLKKITHHTQDPHPDGLGHFNPIKLYTSKELIAHMKRNDKTLQIYWDDLRLWKNKKPE
ncbi:MAG: hypothetical protein WEB30_16990 [Cyclobacteriaceae bacterium]